MMYPIIENKVSQYHITKEALLSFLRTLFPGILDNEFNVKVLLVDHIPFCPKRLLIRLQSKNDRWKFNAPRTIEDVSHYKSWQPTDIPDDSSQNTSEWFSPPGLLARPGTSADD